MTIYFISKLHLRWFKCLWEENLELYNFFMYKFSSLIPVSVKTSIEVDIATGFNKLNFVQFWSTFYSLFDYRTHCISSHHFFNRLYRWWPRPLHHQPCGLRSHALPYIITNSQWLAPSIATAFWALAKIVKVFSSRSNPVWLPNALVLVSATRHYPIMPVEYEGNATCQCLPPLIQPCPFLIRPPSMIDFVRLWIKLPPMWNLYFMVDNLYWWWYKASIVRYIMLLGADPSTQPEESKLFVCFKITGCFF